MKRRHDGTTGARFAGSVAMATLALVLGTAWSAQAQRAVQLTPDGERYLINSFVPPNEQWAITYNPTDRTFTGNVFKTDGGPPSFIWCQISSIEYAPSPADNNYTFNCMGSNACTQAPCDPGQWSAIPAPGVNLNIGGDFVLPPGTQTTLGGTVQPIFSSRCALPACHDDVTASGMQTLVAGAAYGDTVGVSVFESPGSIRIVPFDPDSSYLLGKVLGTAPGNRMPLGGAPLPDNEINAIRTWIQEGAVDN